MPLGDIKKLNLLSKNMDIHTVQGILGEPKQKELKAGNTVLKYKLHEWMSGWKPVYFIFDENEKLIEWYVDMEEFNKGQKILYDSWQSIQKNFKK